MPGKVKNMWFAPDALLALWTLNGTRVLLPKRDMWQCVDTFRHSPRESIGSYVCSSVQPEGISSGSCSKELLLPMWHVNLGRIVTYMITEQLLIVYTVDLARMFLIFFLWLEEAREKLCPLCQSCQWVIRGKVSIQCSCGPRCNHSIALRFRKKQRTEHDGLFLFLLCK